MSSGPPHKDTHRHTHTGWHTHTHVHRTAKSARWVTIRNMALPCPTICVQMFNSRELFLCSVDRQDLSRQIPTPAVMADNWCSINTLIAIVLVLCGTLDLLSRDALCRAGDSYLLGKAVSCENHAGVILFSGFYREVPIPMTTPWLTTFWPIRGSCRRGPRCCRCLWRARASLTHRTWELWTKQHLPRCHLFGETKLAKMFRICPLYTLYTRFCLYTPLGGLKLKSFFWWPK